MIGGTIQHEFLHALGKSTVSLMYRPSQSVVLWSHAFLGFYHEQSRPDRDTYVNIQWSNIVLGRFVSVGNSWHRCVFLYVASRFNFDKYNESEVDTLMTPYDYGSVMHYGATAFAMNSSVPTILRLCLHAGKHDNDSHYGDNWHWWDNSIVSCRLSLWLLVNMFVDLFSLLFLSRW